MSEYRLLIANDVLEFLEDVPKKDRQRLRNQFLQIAAYPGNFADFQERDANGRFLDVHVLDKYAIRYWWDFADRDVKILELRLADR